MKRYLLHAASILAVLAGSTVVYAQMGQEQSGQWGHGPGQPMTADQRLQHMTKQLNLSDAQQQQIKPILENEEKQMQTLRDDSSLSQQDRMGKMMQIRQDTSSQIKPILNQRPATKVRGDDEPPRPGPGRTGTDAAARPEPITSAVVI